MPISPSLRPGCVLLWLLAINSCVQARAPVGDMIRLARQCLDSLGLSPPLDSPPQRRNSLQLLSAHESWLLLATLRSFAFHASHAKQSAHVVDVLLGVLSRQPCVRCHMTHGAAGGGGGAGAGASKRSLCSVAALCEGCNARLSSVGPAPVVVHAEVVGHLWLLVLATLGAAEDPLVVDLALQGRPLPLRRRPVEPQLVQLPVLPALPPAPAFCVQDPDSTSPQVHPATLASQLRSAVARALDWCGVRLDAGPSTAPVPDAVDLGVHVEPVIVALVGLAVRLECQLGNAARAASVLHAAARDLYGCGNTDGGGGGAGEFEAFAWTKNPCVAPELVASAAALIPRQFATTCV